MKDSFYFSFADLIDRLTISQIKETLFTGAKRNAAGRAIRENERALERMIRRKRIPPSANLIRLVAIVAQANLHVWQMKERAAGERSRYMKLLRRAQEINGVKNHARNALLAIAGELTPALRRATFLDRKPGRWYGHMVASLPSPISAGRLSRGRSPAISR